MTINNTNINNTNNVILEIQRATKEALIRECNKPSEERRYYLNEVTEEAVKKVLMNLSIERLVEYLHLSIGNTRNEVTDPVEISFGDPRGKDALQDREREVVEEREGEITSYLKELDDDRINNANENTNTTEDYKYVLWMDNTDGTADDICTWEPGEIDEDDITEDAIYNTLVWIAHASDEEIKPTTYHIDKMVGYETIEEICRLLPYEIIERREKHLTE